MVFRTTDNFFYFDETVQFEVSLTTALVDVNSFEVLDIYTNPPSTNFPLSLSLDNGQDIVVDIYNVLGIKVSSDWLNLSAGNHIIIKNFDIKSGQYFVNITDINRLTITKKLLMVK